MARCYFTADILQRRRKAAVPPCGCHVTAGTGGCHPSFCSIDVLLEQKHFASLQGTGRSICHVRAGVSPRSPRVCPSGTLRGLSHPEEHLEEANGSPRWVGAGTSADPTGSACELHRNSPPGLGTRCSKWSPRLAMVRKTFSCSLPVHYENPLKGAFRTTKPFKRILLEATKATLTALAFKSTWVFKLWKTLFYFSKFLCVCFSRLGLLTGFREMFSVIASVRKCITRLIPITIFKTICKHILHKMDIQIHGSLPQ